jgi:DNA-binding transcriptional ArsR family regulator
MGKSKGGANTGKSPGEVLRHPLRVRILAACTLRETSVREFADREKASISKVRYHVRILEAAGYLRVSRQQRARGFRRNLYVAIRNGLITDAEFAEMTFEERRLMSVASVRDFYGQCLTALDEGTFDRRLDSHFTWCLRTFDERGWKDLTDHLAGSFDRSSEIEAESLARLRKSGGMPVFTTVGLAGFESPPEKDPEQRQP